MRHKINWYNIYQYVIGQTRYYLHKIHPRLIRKHIREQVEYRMSACSPVCKYEARCCGCKAPNVFYSPKGCRFNSYPALMSKPHWEDYMLKYQGRMEYLVDTIFGYHGNRNIFYTNGLSYKEINELKSTIYTVEYDNKLCSADMDDLFIEIN